MKVVFDCDDIKVFLSNEYVNMVKLDDFERLEYYLKEIIVRFKKVYHIDIIGLYDLEVKYDKFYGFVLYLEKQSYDEYNLFVGQIDFNLNIDKNHFFLYEISDFFGLNKNILLKSIIYNYKQKLYLKLKEQLSNIEMGCLTEVSNIISDDIVYKIINKGKPLKLNKGCGI